MDSAPDPSPLDAPQNKAANHRTNQDFDCLQDQLASRNNHICQLAIENDALKAATAQKDALILHKDTQISAMDSKIKVMANEIELYKPAAIMYSRIMNQHNAVAVAKKRFAMLTKLFALMQNGRVWQEVPLVVELGPSLTLDAAFTSAFKHSRLVENPMLRFAASFGKMEDGPPKEELFLKVKKELANASLEMTQRQKDLSLPLFQDLPRKVEGFSTPVTESTFLKSAAPNCDSVKFGKPINHMTIPHPSMAKSGDPYSSQLPSSTLGNNLRPSDAFNKQPPVTKMDDPILQEAYRSKMKDCFRMISKTTNAPEIPEQILENLWKQEKPSARNDSSAFPDPVFPNVDNAPTKEAQDSEMKNPLDEMYNDVMKWIGVVSNRL